MRWPSFILLCLSTLPATLQAQFEIEESHTTASLRGIDNVGGGVAWASGTNGTVLRTEDGGYLWQTCTVPPGAEHLDFRGIQAFDENIAIVMSSGKGDFSRLYKTADGCKTWKLLFTNPDKDGFWDALQAHVAGPFDMQICRSDTPVITGAILGDPLIHKSNQWDNTTYRSFYLATFTVNSSCSEDKLNPSASAIFSRPGEAAFAASNSVLFELGPKLFWIATSREIIQYEFGSTTPGKYDFYNVCGIDVPLQRGEPSQGMFSFAIRLGSIEQPTAIKVPPHSEHCMKADVVAVGGNYAAPNDREKTSAFTGGSNMFQPSQTPPGGYRSAVAYDEKTKTWITVGPNGTDISRDDGKNWTPLKPGPLDQPDSDKNWNALSLPFVVGPSGRIGKLRNDALTPTPKP